MNKCIPSVCMFSVCISTCRSSLVFLHHIVIIRLTDSLRKRKTKVCCLSINSDNDGALFFLRKMKTELSNRLYTSNDRLEERGGERKNLSVDIIKHGAKYRHSLFVSLCFLCHSLTDEEQKNWAQRMVMLSWRSHRIFLVPFLCRCLLFFSPLLYSLGLLLFLLLLSPPLLRSMSISTTNK